METFFEKEHVRIVEKEQETHSDLGKYESVCMCDYCTTCTVDVMSSGMHRHQPYIVFKIMFLLVYV